MHDTSLLSGQRQFVLGESHGDHMRSGQRLDDQHVFVGHLCIWSVTRFINQDQCQQRVSLLHRSGMQWCTWSAEQSSSPDFASNALAPALDTAPLAEKALPRGSKRAFSLCLSHLAASVLRGANAKQGANNRARSRPHHHTTPCMVSAQHLVG